MTCDAKEERRPELVRTQANLGTWLFRFNFIVGFAERAFVVTQKAFFPLAVSAPIHIASVTVLPIRASLTAFWTICHASPSTRALKSQLSVPEFLLDSIDSLLEVIQFHAERCHYAHDLCPVLATEGNWCDFLHQLTLSCLR